MSDLSSAQIIGGVAVTISARLDGLKAGVAEAKTIAQTAERSLRISLPVIADTAQLKAEIPRIVSAANLAVRAMPIRIPVMLDMSGVAAQLGQMRAMLGGGGFSIPTVTSGAPYTPVPLMLAGAAGGAAGGALARITGGGTTQMATVARAGGAGGQNWTWGNNPGTVNVPGAAGGGGAGGGSIIYPGAAGAGTAGSAGQAARRGFNIRSLMIAGAIVKTVSAGAEAGLAYASERAARERGDLEGELAGQSGRESVLKGIPFGIGSLGTSIRDVASWHGGRNDRAYINEITAATALQDQKNARLAIRADAGRSNMVTAQGETRRIGLSNSLAFATSGESGVAQAHFALSEFNRQQEEFRQANNLKGDSPDVQAQRAALTQATKIAGQQRGIEQQVFNGRIQASTQGAAIGIAGVRAYAAGDTEAAAKAERDVQRLSLVQQQKERVALAPDSEKAGLRTANKAELKLFDEQSAQQAMERQKARAADLTQTIGTKQAAALTISKQYFQAELAAFDAKTKAEISLIDDKAAKQNAADRAAAQRAVMVAQEQQRVETAVNLSTAGAASSNLRIAHKGDQASLVEFDARAAETLKNIANPQEKAAKQAELDAQRAEMVNQQREAKENRQAGYSTRTAQAQAFDKYGNYQSGVAGIIGTIAQDKAELRNADAGDRAQIKETQIAELKGAEKRVLGANAMQYAQAFDPRYDAARGGENETVNILKQIRDYLRQLNGGSAGTTPAIP